MRYLQPRDEYYLGAVIILVGVLCWVSFAYPHDRLHPELDNWFMGLQSKSKSPCCDKTEATRLDDVDWDVKDGHYRVRLEGQWWPVPDGAVIDEPNLAGVTMVWPIYYRDHDVVRSIQVRCFIVGTMG